VIEIHPLRGIPEIEPGDDLASLIATAMADTDLTPRAGDVLVVTHKIVSKSEGATAVLVGDEDAAYRVLIEEEASEILRRRGDLMITKTHHGFICANAGIDRSNTAPGTAVLLPRDPDRSAHTLRMGLLRATGVGPGDAVSATWRSACRGSTRSSTCAAPSTTTAGNWP